MAETGTPPDIPETGCPPDIPATGTLPDIPETGAAPDISGTGGTLAGVAEEALGICAGAANRPPLAVAGGVTEADQGIAGVAAADHSAAGVEADAPPP